ncbi:MAG TPA: hypothetical protein EYP95_00440 [Nitrospinaceae bacterium]|nr:hypothetical protein [Nitrospinaceae bacterium]
MRYGYVYISKNQINGERYLGQHIGQIKDPEYLGSGVELKKQVEEYGAENFTNRVVEWADGSDALFLAECKWMNKTGAVEKDEWMNKMHPSSYPKVTPETCAKIVATRKRNGSYGNYHTVESLAKAIATRKRNGTLNPNTPESIEKRIATRKRNGTLNTQTPESIEKSIATRKRNGTMDTNTPESIAKQHTTKMERYGTLNTTTPESCARGWETRRRNKNEK